MTRFNGDQPIQPIQPIRPVRRLRPVRLWRQPVYHPPAAPERMEAIKAMVKPVSSVGGADRWEQDFTALDHGLSQAQGLELPEPGTTSPNAVVRAYRTGGWEA